MKWLGGISYGIIGVRSSEVVIAKFALRRGNEIIEALLFSANIPIETSANGGIEVTQLERRLMSITAWADSCMVILLLMHNIISYSHGE